MGGGGTILDSTTSKLSDPQLRMQNMQADQMRDVWNQTGGADRFGRSSNLYSPSAGEQDIANQWSQMLQGAQTWSPYNSGNNPYSGRGGGQSSYGGRANVYGPSGGGMLEGGSGAGGQPSYGGNPNVMGLSGEGGGQSNNPAEEWYKRMQGAIGAGAQMPNLQGPDIQGMGPLQGPDIQGMGAMQGPDIRGPSPMQGPDIREMGPLNQAPTPEAAIAAAQKNLNTITSPALAQQAAATGGSMDSGAYLEALANAGTAASVPISQQQLAMQGQFGMQGNELMSQQNQQANAIRSQFGLQGNDINSQFGLQGNDIRRQYGLQANDIGSQFGLQGNQIRGQYGLQGNDIANQQNQMGNQIRAGYGMQQANDLAGALAQGRQGQLRRDWRWERRGWLLG